MLSGTIFITGVTGFLGEELLALLAATPVTRIYCLIRSSTAGPAAARFDALLKSCGLEHDSRVSLVEGDLRLDRLGLTEGRYAELASEVTRIIHAAADVRFNQSLADSRAVNVDGLRRLLDFARACRARHSRFSHLDYVGTAFIAGRSHGVVTEDDANGKSGFRNPYEQSKFEAEELIRSASADLPVIVYRPSIILGASASGKARPRNVLFPLLRVLSTWRWPFVPARRDVHLDVVPVDFVAKAILAISANPANIGGHFHLAAGPDGDVTLGRFLDLIGQAFGRRMLVIPAPVWKFGVRPLVRAIRPRWSSKIKPTIDAFEPYLFEPGPRFDINRTVAALEGSDVRVPKAEQFLAACLTFARDTNFGDHPVVAPLRSAIDEPTVGAMFRHQAAARADRACVSVKVNGQYVDLSWRQMSARVRELAVHLRQIGIKPGDRIAILSKTRYEWWLADLATLSIGAVVVPIHATNSAIETQHVLGHSGSRLCFVGDADQLEQVIAMRAELPALERLIVFDQLNVKRADVETLDAVWGNRGVDHADEIIGEPTADDLATIVYTSGTSDHPKGVMLTHGNLMANVRQLNTQYLGRATMPHRFLSFLPLSHVLERMCGCYVPISQGYTVAFAESVGAVLENLREVRPTTLVGVPRMFERMYEAIHGRVRSASRVRRALFSWASRVAAVNAGYVEHDRTRRGLFALRFWLADVLVFNRIKRALGFDRLRFASTGGGALAPDVMRFFLGLDIHVLEGYGLTEASPVVSTNPHTRLKPGTAGRPLPDTIVRVEGDSELLVRGPQIMRGYYNDTAATRAAFSDDGFLRTGDLGHLDEDGYLVIDGRKRDQMVTSAGENVAPHRVEARLMASPFIEHAVVVGDGRPFLSCLIVPAFQELDAWSTETGLTAADRLALLQDRRVQDLFLHETTRRLDPLSRIEQVKRVILLDHVWAQSSGELTPSMKVRRRVINEKYRDVINRAYAAGDRHGDGPVRVATWTS